MLIMSANKTLGFLCQNVNITSEKEQDNKPLIRSSLEYVWSAWDSYNKSEINQLETAQRRAVMFVAKSQHMNCRSLEVVNIDFA